MPDGHARVSEGVAGERDQQDLGVARGQGLDAVEPEPLLARDLVLDPAGSMSPVGRDVALAFAPTRVHRRLQLAPEQVDFGLGEVGQAAGMVEVEVGGDHMAHVVRIKAALTDLGDRGLTGAGARTDERVEERAELARIARIVEAEACVDQDQTVRALDQQAVADEPRLGQESAAAGQLTRTTRAHRAAVEVMDGARRGVHPARKPTWCRESEFARTAVRLPGLARSAGDRVAEAASAAVDAFIALLGVRHLLPVGRVAPACPRRGR